METPGAHSAASEGTGVPQHHSQPKHKHDCDTCIFLGRHLCVGEYAGGYDLYYHAGCRATESVIARFGEDGDYYSGMHFAAPYVDISRTQQPGITPLVEAKRRAIARGLISTAEAA